MHPTNHECNLWVFHQAALTDGWCRSAMVWRHSSLERAFTSLLRGCKWCFLQAAWFLTAGAYALEGSSTRGCQRHEQNHNGCCYENHWPNFCVRSHLLIPSVACFCPSKLMMAISSILIPRAGASGVEIIVSSLFSLNFWLPYRFGLTAQHSYLSKCDNDYSFCCWAALAAQCSSDFNHSFCRSIDRVKIDRCFIC